MTKAADATKRKLKYYYKSQDKLIPLFDDHRQSIANCYIQLVLLTQQQFQERKDKITNKNNEEKLEDIWGIKTEKGRLKIRHISIHGEAGTGKSVLTQRIAWLWIKKQMWRDHFQLLLHIPLRKIANIFDNTLDEKDNVIEMQWSKIMGELNIPQWDTNDTEHIAYTKNGLLLVLDGFDEIANELNSKPVVTIQYISYLDNNLRIFNVIGFQRQDIQNYVNAYFRNIDNYQANVLIDIFDNNPSLKLLSHTPLYLRLFCYLARQQMNEIEEEKKKDQTKGKLFDGLNGISLSKLYEKLL
ncbi:hypothetical protein RFI_35795, partial [Reticulomyxa filosa]